MTDYVKQIEGDIREGHFAFYLTSNETASVDNLVQAVAERLNFKVIECNLAYGIVDFETKSTNEDYSQQVGFEQIFQQLLDEDLENKLILVKNAKAGLEHNSAALSRLQFLLERVQRHLTTQCALILQSADVYLPSDIESLFTLIHLPLLTGYESKRQKEQLLARSGLLSFVEVKETLDDIGGLDNLKNWLNEQSNIFTRLEEAKEFGIAIPKGTLIAGMPGCGKSLTAKAAAATFELPLVRLDMGSLLGKYVGESEANMRKALSLAESVSPCILWIDELEKAFAGTSGNNASEVGARLLGYFLTWLQDNKAEVFVIATANDITVLPPELLRKGRFDEIFYVGFPNKTERKEILEIQLARKKHSLEPSDIEEIADLCRDYSSADILSAVTEAAKKAFLQKQAGISKEILIESIKATIPLRKTLKEKIAEYERKFNELSLTPASKETDDGLSITKMLKMAEDPNYLERIKVAESEDVTEDILEKLTQDKHFEVREAAFSNPHCPRYLLDKQYSLDDDDPAYDRDLKEVIMLHNNVSFSLIVGDVIYEDDDVKDVVFNNPAHKEALLDFARNADFEKFYNFYNYLGKTNNKELLLNAVKNKTLASEHYGLYTLQYNQNLDVEILLTLNEYQDLSESQTKDFLDVLNTMIERKITEKFGDELDEYSEKEREKLANKLGFTGLLEKTNYFEMLAEQEQNYKKLFKEFALEVDKVCKNIDNFRFVPSKKTQYQPEPVPEPKKEKSLIDKLFDLF